MRAVQPEMRAVQPGRFWRGWLGSPQRVRRCPHSASQQCRGAPFWGLFL